MVVRDESERTFWVCEFFERLARYFSIGRHVNRAPASINDRDPRGILSFFESDAMKKAEINSKLTSAPSMFNPFRRQK